MAVIGVTGLDKILAQVGQKYAQLESQIDHAVQKAGADCERRAKLLCPVDTGNLRASIQYENVGKFEAIVGTNTEYAPFVELGTSHQVAQPYLYPAYEWTKKDLMEALKKLR